MADDRAGAFHALPGRRIGEHASVPPDRHAVPLADHSGLHRLVVLGVPRQGARRYRLSSLDFGHCEEPTGPARSSRPDDRLRDEAIQLSAAVLDCFASLAMTWRMDAAPVIARKAGL